MLTAPEISYNIPSNLSGGVLSVSTVAGIFGMSPRWVYNHVSELGGFRIGRSIFFTREGVQDAIQRGQKVAGNAQIQRAETSNKDLQDKKGSLTLRKGHGKKRETAREEIAKRAGLAKFL